MKLTSHEEYGFRCLVKIGASGGALTIPEISDAEGISQAYAAKLLRTLRKGGFLKSARGNVGGYSLSRPANQIIVGEVLAALDGKMFETDFCDSHSGHAKVCAHSTDCSIRTLWNRVQFALDEVLGKTTLEDILRHEPQVTAFVGTLAQSAPPTLS
jgi:Rrf2 family transcriptional regulator, iron-sulfur cluster assembly transcription factor